MKATRFFVTPIMYMWQITCSASMSSCTLYWHFQLGCRAFKSPLTPGMVAGKPRQQQPPINVALLISLQPAAATIAFACTRARKFTTPMEQGRCRERKKGGVRPFSDLN